MAAEAESSDGNGNGVKLLSGTDDQYGGVIVDINEPMDSAAFLSVLTSSIAHWKLQQGKCGVWSRNRCICLQSKQRGLHYSNTNTVPFIDHFSISSSVIDSEFVEVLGFRQSHKSFFEKLDLFFVCLLKPNSFDIQKQEQEIEAAQWMSFEEYAAQPFVQKSEFLKSMNEVCREKMEGEYTGLSPVLTTSSTDDKKDYFYLNSSKAPKGDSKD